MADSCCEFCWGCLFDKSPVLDANALKLRPRTQPLFKLDWEAFAAAIEAISVDPPKRSPIVREIPRYQAGITEFDATQDKRFPAPAPAPAMPGLANFLYGPPRNGGWPDPAAMGLFGGGSAPKPPPPPPPLPIPDLLDPAALAAGKRRREAMTMGTGRASTILTGGDEYSGDKLGAR